MTMNMDYNLPLFSVSPLAVQTKKYADVIIPRGVDNTSEYFDSVLPRTWIGNTSLDSTGLS